jgi:hypothetical protein
MKRSPTAKRVDVTGTLPDLSKRPTVFIDVDDTIIARIWDDSGFDLRPNVMTQLRVLKELYNVRWLTCWGPEPLKKLIDNLYGQDIWRDTEYCAWMTRLSSGKNEKVDAVLEGPEDWYWLEDPLYGDDLLRLREAGLEHRYIRVEPRGQWGFADACKKLFALTNVDAKRLIDVGAKMEWFEHS